MRTDAADRRIGADALAPTDLALVAGLVTIFLVNAVLAVVEPDAFHRILSSSPLTRWTGIGGRRWGAAMIAVSDGTIASLLVATVCLRRGHRWALGMAGVWLALAAVLKL